MIDLKRNTNSHLPGSGVAASNSAAGFDFSNEYPHARHISVEPQLHVRMIRLEAALPVCILVALADHVESSFPFFLWHRHDLYRHAFDACLGGAATAIRRSQF